MDKNKIINEFDGKAEEYEQNRLGDWYIAQLQLLVQHIDDTVRGDILDIGCGTGWLLRSLATSQPGRRYMGIDISSAMIATAQSNVPATVSNMEFIASDWESMDLERLSSYRFAGIVCTSALHYFANPREALSKMYGLLSENGSIYLIERDKSASPLTAMWDLLHRHYIKDHVRFYSSVQLQAMLGEAGFSNIEILETVKRYFWHGKLQTNIVFLRGQRVRT